MCCAFTSNSIFTQTKPAHSRNRAETFYSAVDTALHISFTVPFIQSGAFSIKTKEQLPTSLLSSFVGAMLIT